MFQDINAQLLDPKVDSLGRGFISNIQQKRYNFLNTCSLPMADSVYVLNIYGKNTKNALDNSKIAKFNNLTVLTIVGSFNKLPEVIFEMPNIKELRFVNITGLNWDSTFKELSKIPQLKSLRIQSLSLDQLPNSIGLLTQLERLEIYYGYFKHLPDSFINLTNLKYINILYTNLTHLPTNYFNDNLLYLDISANRFNGMPKEINNFPELRYLRFIDNKYLSSNDTIVCKNRKIENLNLSGCGIEKFPIGLICLPKLKGLALFDNRIPILPKEIENFKSLRILAVCTFNGQLVNLEYLSEKMPDCKFWTMPEINL